MSSDSDSEIECWDGVKPSPSVSQPANNVSIAHAVYKTDAAPASSKKIKAPPDSLRKRKRSDAFPRTQDSFCNQQSHRVPPMEAQVIDLTDDNIDIEHAAFPESVGGNNNVFDRTTNQETSGSISMNGKRLKQVIDKKSEAVSISGKPCVSSISRPNSLSSRQSSSTTDNRDVVDVADGQGTSSAEFQPPLPMASVETQQPAAAFHSESVHSPFQADESADECGLEKTRFSNRKTMELQIGDMDEQSSRSSWSPILSNNKSKDEFHLTDYDTDSSSISYATQESTSSSRGPCYDIAETVTDSFVPSDASGSSTTGRLRDNAAMTRQTAESHEKQDNVHLPSAAAKKKVMSRKGSKRTTTLDRIDYESSSDSESSTGVLKSIGPTECHDKQDYVHPLSAAAKKKVMPRKVSQRTMSLDEIDYESDLDSDSSFSASVSSQPIERHDKQDKIHAAKKKVMPRKGSKRTTPLDEIDYESDLDSDSSFSASVSNQPIERHDKQDKIHPPSAVAKKKVMSRKGSKRTTPLDEVDHDSGSDSCSSSSVIEARQPIECHDKQDDVHPLSAAAKKKVMSRKGSKRTTPLDEIDYESDLDSDSSFSASVASQPIERHDKQDKIHPPSDAAKKKVMSRKGSKRTTPLDGFDYESSSDSGSSSSAIESSQPTECHDKPDKTHPPSGAAKKKAMSRKGSKRTAPLDEVDNDSGSYSGSFSSTIEASQPTDNTVNAPGSAAKKKVMPRKAPMRTTSLAEVEHGSDWDTDVSQESEKIEQDDVAGSVTAVCRATGYTGYPIRRFSVYGGDDDILYDFRVFVDKSQIPNAGLGAFLAYQGARKLCTRLQTHKVCDDLLSDCFYHEATTMSPLIAALPDGQTKCVKLTGENLHGNYNCVYWPRRLPSKRLPVKSNGKTINIKIVGECLESFKELESRPDDGIGHLGMYSEHDYEHVSGIPCKQNFCFELDAPYAPLGPNDRKAASLFDIKSFLFDNEPAAWAFDVDEKIRGQDQVCDITDDATGEPHVFAKNEVPMYVNEVGNSGFKENVLIRHVHNRTPKYFVQLKDSMKPGETVELLTNYGRQYEDVRIRKGYGLKSICRGDKSDDDLGARLKRNFSLRAVIETSCTALSLPDLNRILEYVCNQIWDPLCGMVVDIFAASDFPNCASSLTPIQWVAFLRLFWFRSIAEKRLSQLETALAKQPKTVLFCGHIFKACSKALQKIRFPDGISLVGLLDQIEARKTISVALRRVSEAINRELTEDFYYDLRDRIRHPFCSEMWCPVGVAVLASLGRGYTKLKLESLEESRTIDRSKLEALLVDVATVSSQRMEATKTGQFHFSSGTSCDRLSFDVLQRILDGGKVGKAASLIENNDKIPKALHALAHRWLSAERPFNRGEDVTVFCNKKFVVLCGTPNVGSLTSYVTEVASPEHNLESALLNQTYYKIWQIAYPIMECAHRHLDESCCDRIESALSKTLRIERKLLTYAYRKQMTTDTNTAAYLLYPEAKESAKKLYQSRVRSARKDQKRLAYRLKHPASRAEPKSRPEKKQKLKPSNHGGTQGSRPPAKLIYEGPPQTRLEQGGRTMQWPDGWTQKTYQRQTGDSKGATDYYFYSPQLQIKIRSKADVFRFLDKLAECGGDESKIRHKSA